MSLIRCIGGAALSLLVALPVVAADNAQLIFIDPSTGELRAPTPQDWANLPARSVPKARVPAQVLPDGTILLPAEAVMHRMTAVVGPDGRVHANCADHEHAE